MRLEGYISLAVVLLVSLLGASCEKAESPIAMPTRGVAQLARVDMGEDYQNQIFFSFASGESVMSSKVNSWDLAFEAGPDGYHIFMNGAKDLLCYKTQSINANAITESHALVVNELEWGFDGPSGLPDSTFIGDWRGKNQVYIIKFNDETYKKIVFSSVSDTAYTITYGDINSQSLTSFKISKNAAFNYSYFSFDNGGMQVFPDPPKHTWDIVFTRYRHIYYDLNDLRYVVTGVLLNPYKTAAMKDSITAFSNLNFSAASTLTAMDDRRNVIGFDWKTYNSTSGNYVANPQKCYVVKTQQEQFWKLRFIDFYNVNGIKGSPSFEFERIK